MRVKAPPRIRLLPYRSNVPMHSGVQIVADARIDVQALVADLQWLIAESEHAASPDFFVVDTRRHLEAAQLDLLAKAAGDTGLAERLCLVVPFKHRSADLRSRLQDFGIRILLGDVGADARFADLLTPFADGIVFDTALVSEAAGDPQMASVLEAMTHLAVHLGLRTFANRCPHEVDSDIATGCGVHYVSLDASANSRHGHGSMLVTSPHR